MINPIGNKGPEELERPGVSEEAAEANKAEAAKNNQKTPPTPPPDQGDKVELSELAKDVKTIRENMSSQEKSRAELVDMLRKKIEDGTYQVNSMALAQKIYVAAGLQGKE